MKSAKKGVSTSCGKPKEWNPQKNKKWKPNKGMSICEYCYEEKAKPEVSIDQILGYNICNNCQEKREKISKRAKDYWKGKEPTVRRVKE